MSKQTMTKTCKTHPYIDDYLSKIATDDIKSSGKMKSVVKLVYRKLDDEDVFIDAEKIDKAVELIEKYFEMTLLDWELCQLALIHCYYKSADSVVFDEFLIVMGRGNGKNGFISPIAWYLTTHYHGIKGYNIDIIANNEEQAKTSFNDVYDVIEKFWGKLKNFFYKSKVRIVNLKTKSYIEYNTSNARTKDGKRSACLIFDEVHEYENYDAIKVFTSGFGKRKHSRTFYLTTNGYVREGVLDDLLEMADRVLEGEADELGLLPFIYSLDNEKEAYDEKNWIKANPSLPYFPELKKEIKKDFMKMKYQPHKKQDFFTKRMNMPRGDTEFIVADFEAIRKTNKPIPDLRGRTCIVGIDYASMNDMASVNLHFRESEKRFDINHSWLCLQSADLPRIRVPWQQWVDDGLLTAIDAPQILPEVICDYINEQGQIYNIVALAMDNFRYSLLSSHLDGIGFSKDRGNLQLIRPSDIMKVVPVIDSCFTNDYYHWGNNPLFRWATNNTKRVASGRKQGTDTGNYYYGKIEGKSRKTDPFMAHVASMCIEGRLGDGIYKEPSFVVY